MLCAFRVPKVPDSGFREMLLGTGVLTCTAVDVTRGFERHIREQRVRAKSVLCVSNTKSKLKKTSDGGEQHSGDSKKGGTSAIHCRTQKGIFGSFLLPSISCKATERAQGGIEKQEDGMHREMERIRENHKETKMVMSGLKPALVQQVGQANSIDLSELVGKEGWK